QSAVQFGLVEFPSQRIGKPGYAAHFLGHVGYRFFTDAQSRQHGLRHGTRTHQRFRGAQILSVRGDDLPFAFFQTFGGQQQGIIALLVRKHGQLTRSPARPPRRFRRAGLSITVRFACACVHALASGRPALSGGPSSRTMFSREKMTRATFLPSPPRSLLAHSAMPRANSRPFRSRMLTTSIGENSRSTRTTPESSRLALPAVIARWAPASTTTRPRTPAA